MRRQATTATRPPTGATRTVGTVRPPAPWLVPALMVVASAAVLWSTSSGPGLSPDSVVYVNAADSWLAGEGLDAFGRPVTLWPPGYPLVLALLARLGVDLQLGVVVLNVVSTAAAVWLGHRLARVVGLGRWTCVAVAAVVALGVSTVRIGSMAWSEPLFLAVALAALVACSRWLARAPRWWEIGVVAALVSLACVLRYAGVALAPAVVVGCVIGVRRSAAPHGTRLSARLWARTVVLAAGSSVGLAAVVARNLSLGVGPSGDRVGTGMSPVRAFGHLLRALGQVVVPEPGGLLPLVAGDVGSTVTVLLTGAWFALGAAVLALWLWGAWSQLRPVGPGVCVATFSAAYVVVLLYATVSAGVDPPNDRLLQPVLPAVVVLVAVAGRDVSRRWATRGSAPATRLSALRRPAATAFVVWALASTAASAVVASRAADSGIGYNSAAVEGSSLTAAIRALPASDGVALSDPWQGYWILRRDVVSVYESDLVERVRSGAVDHVVLYPASTNERVTVAALRQRGLDLREVGRGPDGVLYRVAVNGSS